MSDCLAVDTYPVERGDSGNHSRLKHNAVVVLINFKVQVNNLLPLVGESHRALTIPPTCTEIHVYSTLAYVKVGRKERQPRQTVHTKP